MIELLPNKADQKSQMDFWFWGLVIGLLIVVLGFSLYLQKWAGDLVQSRNRLVQKLADLNQTNKELVTRLERLKDYQQLQARDNLIIYRQILADLNRIVPIDAGLTKLQVKNQKRLKLTGKAEANQPVISLLDKSSDYPYFKAVELTASQPKETGVEFELVGEIIDEKN